MAQFLDLEMDTSQADLHALQHLVSQLPRNAHFPQRIVEVGSWTGRTALALANTPRQNVQVYCIDHWQGSHGDRTEALLERYPSAEVAEAFYKNIGRHLFHTIFPCYGSSAFWAEHWPLGLVDMVFIDADHRYEAVARDIACWQRHISRGGILCGHDYTPAFPGVMRAADEVGIDGRLGASVWYKQL